jgi:hypothetical protein
MGFGRSWLFSQTDTTFRYRQIAALSHEKSRRSELIGGSGFKSGAEGS